MLGQHFPLLGVPGTWECCSSTWNFDDSESIAFACSHGDADRPQLDLGARRGEERRGGGGREGRRRRGEGEGEGDAARNDAIMMHDRDHDGASW